jgi:hypothetical protein
LDPFPLLLNSYEDLLLPLPITERGKIPSISLWKGERRDLRMRGLIALSQPQQSQLSLHRE